MDRPVPMAADVKVGVNKPRSLAVMAAAALALMAAVAFVALRLLTPPSKGGGHQKGADC